VTRRPARRRLVVAAAILGAVLGVVAIRAVWQGRAALARGDAALIAGDADGAIRWWRRAARWYLPLAPHVTAAYQRLEELAGHAEAAGDRATALAAWQGVRGSILSTRSFYTPFEERLEPANRRIAALMAAWEAELAAAGGPPPPPDPAAWHLARLSHDEAPSVGWTMVALLGLGAWLGGAALFAWRGVDGEDRLVPRTAGVAGLLVAAGLLVWMLGLHNA
jgi:hypothetical protein